MPIEGFRTSTLFDARQLQLVWFLVVQLSDSWWMFQPLRQSHLRLISFSGLRQPGRILCLSLNLFLGCLATDGETALWAFRHLYPHVVMLTCSSQTKGVRSWPPGQILGTLPMLHLMSLACLFFLSLVCKLSCVSSISCILPRCHFPNLTGISL